jgi:hypothetical protein
MNTGELLEDLRKEAEYYSKFVAFFKSLLNNEELETRLNGTDSRIAVDIARASTKESIVLYCVRNFDPDADSISLVNAYSTLKDFDKLIKHRETREAQPLDDRTKLRIHEYHLNLITEYDSLFRDKYYPYVRLLRTEFFAHRVKESKLRKKFANNSISIINPSHNDLISFADRSINVVRLMYYLWNKTWILSQRSIFQTEGRCRKFWTQLPVPESTRRTD